MKHITPLLLALTIIACGTKTETPPATITTDASPSINEQIARQLFEHFNKHEWDKMAALYIDSAEFKDPSFGTGIVKQSRKETIDKYTGMQQMFPDVRDEIVAVYNSGDKNVIVEFVSTGTAPDGTKFELPIVSIFTIEEGMIVKDWTYYDNF